MSRQFTYPIQQLKQGPLNISADLTAAWLNEALADTDVLPSDDAKGSLRCSIVLTGREVVVRGRVDASIAVPCARCLQPAHVAVSGDLSLFLEPSARTHGGRGRGDSDHGKGKAQESEFSAEEAAFDSYDGEQVVLDGFIREAILLEVPIFPLCSDSCEGIDAGPDRVSEADAFEEDGAIDPRLAPLLKLKKEH